ncbi:hypothetical protein FRC03_008051, partial [Tulasnella sp. 419]
AATDRSLIRSPNRLFRAQVQCDLLRWDVSRRELNMMGANLPSNNRVQIGVRPVVTPHAIASIKAEKL